MRPRSHATAWALAAYVLSGGSASTWAESWDKTKADLAERGITPSLLYQGDGSVNAAGGARRGGTYLGNLHVQLWLDGGPLIGVPDLTLYADGLNIHGGQVSGFVGDAQGVSNIAAPPGFVAYEAWLQYTLIDERLSVLAGRYEINSEFYFLKSASLFLNGSFGLGPEFSLSGVAGPSTFPDTSVGARVVYKPAQQVLVQAAVFDGAPIRRPNGTSGVFESGDGLLLVSELDYLDRPRPDPSSGKKTVPIGRSQVDSLYDGKIGVGGWYYTARFDDLSEVDASGQPVRHRGSGGAYLVAERLLLPSGHNADKGLVAFLQAGIGDRRVNRFGSYVGAGLVATDLVRCWPDDQLGLAVAAARNGSHFMSAQREQDIPTRRSEIAVELSYLAPVTGWLKLQPDVQYVIHPNTDPARRNALVFQLQMTLSF